MEYLIGVSLALSVSLLARIIGLDDAWNSRDPERVSLQRELGVRRTRLHEVPFASINDLPIKEAARKFRWERKV